MEIGASQSSGYCIFGLVWRNLTRYGWPKELGHSFNEARVISKYARGTTYHLLRGA
jgi:hypothetical protein